MENSFTCAIQLNGSMNAMRLTNSNRMSLRRKARSTTKNLKTILIQMTQIQILTQIRLNCQI